MLKKLLIAGAGGKLGRRLRKPLSEICEQLISTDIVPLEPISSNESVVLCDLTDESAVEKLLVGVDSIVHFAGYPREASWSTIIPANIVSVTNLWEAAVKNGVGRIVYASSNHVIGFHPSDKHLDTNDEVKCDSRYGVSKAFAETLARFYYEKFGIESLGIRIGRCEDEPTDDRMMSTWIHPEDLVEIVKLGLLQKQVKADIVYGVSNNSRGWWRNPPYAQFPYKPKHSADSYTLDDAASQAAAATTWPFQGGPFAAKEYVGSVNRAAQFYRDDKSKSK
jgi:uronate dehydrogenase